MAGGDCTKMRISVGLTKKDTTKNTNTDGWLTQSQIAKHYNLPVDTKWGKRFGIVDATRITPLVCKLVCMGDTCSALRHRIHNPIVPPNAGSSVGTPHLQPEARGWSR
jgi:hypothetical protein